MNKILFLSALIVLFFTPFVFAQNDGDKVVGIWLTQDKDAKVEIYKSDDKYNGKIIWGKSLYEKDGKTLIKDGKNPDAKLRNRTILNMEFLSGFMYKNGEWTDGKIYDPKSGKTYSANMKLKGNKLDLRGYIGISMFGRTETWERVK